MKTKFFSLAILILIFILWITPGLFGRDPWKADEPYTVGLVNHIVQTGDLVVPTLTGEPFLEKPPIFFITAAGFGKLLSPPFELYDASRLATALFMALTLLFIALAARELYGKKYAPVAFILLIGCMHLQENAHKLITDVALLAGFAIALYGLALSRRLSKSGGFWIGTGTGIGFLSKGLLAPGILGLIALVLLFFPLWRRKEYFVSLGIAALAALPWFIIWPAALYFRSPDLFVEWFWYQNLGRFLGFARGGSQDPHSYYVINLIWIAWPVILPALWSIWHFRKSWKDHPLFQIPLVASIAILGVLSASSSTRALYALPALLPLTLVAASGIFMIPERAKRIANPIILALFTLLAIILWIGWFAFITGSPAFLAQKLHAFQPDYIPCVNALLLSIAVCYTLAWIIVVLKVTRDHEYAVINWTLGIVMAWGLIMTLWLPPLNAGSSYRAAFTELQKNLPEKFICLDSQGLGESERGMLEYFTGIKPLRIGGSGNCDMLLEQRGSEQQPSVVPTGWEKIWEFRRPSIKPKDIFTLYKKTLP
ncbi:MAG: glycosyltransferase family 39 protein [Nitrospirota bacterium]